MHLDGTKNENSRVVLDQNTLFDINSQNGDVVRIYITHAFIKSHNSSNIEVSSVGGLSILYSKLRCLYSSFCNTKQNDIMFYLFSNVNIIFSECNVMNDQLTEPTLQYFYLNACSAYYVKTVFYNIGNVIFCLTSSSKAVCSQCSFSTAISANGVNFESTSSFISSNELILPNKKWCNGIFRTEKSCRHYVHVLLVSACICIIR